jgi:hypothetical protein
MSLLRELGVRPGENVYRIYQEEGAYYDESTGKRYWAEADATYIVSPPDEFVKRFPPGLRFQPESWFIPHQALKDLGFSPAEKHGKLWRKTKDDQ